MSVCAGEVRLTVPEPCLGSEAWPGTGNPKPRTGSAGWCLIATDSWARPVKQAFANTNNKLLQGAECMQTNDKYVLCVPSFVLVSQRIYLLQPLRVLVQAVMPHAHELWTSAAQSQGRMWKPNEDLHLCCCLCCNQWWGFYLQGLNFLGVWQG